MASTMAPNVTENQVSITNVNQTARYEPKFDVKFHTCLLVISLLIIATNGLVIVLFMARESLRKGGKLFLCSLAISDLTTGLVTIPLNIACEVTYTVPLCMSSGILNRFIAISTVYHILAITFETYYAILKPMEHHVRIERRKVLGIISVIWLGALVVAGAPLTWHIEVVKDVRSKNSPDFVKKETIYESFVVAAGLLLPVSLMVFAHARMFTKIAHALKLLHKRRLPYHPPSNTSKYKTALLFAIILLVFILSWSFWFAASLASALGNSRRLLPLWATDCLTIMRYSTSFINPLLYTFFRPDFHNAIKTLLRRTNRRRASVSFTFLITAGRSHRTESQSNVTITQIKETNNSATVCVNPTSNSPRAEEDTRV